MVLTLRARASQVELGAATVIRQKWLAQAVEATPDGLEREADGVLH